MGDLCNWSYEQNKKITDKYAIDLGYTSDVSGLMENYYDENTLDTCKAADPDKALVGAVAGNVLMYATAAKCVGAVTKGIAGFSKLAPWVQSAINTGFTIATVDGANAADDIPSKAEWDASEQLKKEYYAQQGVYYTPVEYSRWENVEDVALAAGKGFVSGATAGSASSLVGNVTASVLTKSGLQAPLKEFTRHLLSNTAFTTSYMGSTYLMDPNYKPTKEQIIQDYSMALLFSAINTGVSSAKLSGTNKMFVDNAMNQMQKEYQSTFSSSISAEQRMAAYNRILEYNKAIRSTINQNCYPGQQKHINDVIEGTYAIDDSVNAAKAKTNLESFIAEEGSIKPKTEANMVPFEVDEGKSGGYTVENGALVVEKYSPINPGPLKVKDSNSFSGGSYTKKVLTEDTIFYRVYSGDGKADIVGSYMTRTPQNGGMQSQLDLALKPEWGNTARYVTKVTVPKGTVIYEGTAAPQIINGGAGTLYGGGNQVFIPKGALNPLWFGS